MNREIKFRVWDKEIKLMRNVNSIYFPLDSSNGKDLCVSDIDTPSIDEWLSIKDSILMQYTGLKDKNGKEIYEGDIIEIYNWGVHTKNELLVIAKVTWNIDNHSWTWMNSKGQESCTDNYNIDIYDRWRNIKIIGNIYENPELLKT